MKILKFNGGRGRKIFLTPPPAPSPAGVLTILRAPSLPPGGAGGKGASEALQWERPQALVKIKLNIRPQLQDGFNQKQFFLCYRPIKILWYYFESRGAINSIQSFRNPTSTLSERADKFMIKFIMSDLA